MAHDERSRILGMLEDGRINAEQAATLLDAVARRAPRPPTPPRPPAPGTAPKPRPPAQLLRISIDARGGETQKANVQVDVPLTLARFAARFMPAEARRALEEQGVDLGELIAGLGEDVPDGPLVDIDVDDADSKAARIRVEVA